MRVAGKAIGVSLGAGLRRRWPLGSFAHVRRRQPIALALVVCAFFVLAPVSHAEEVTLRSDAGTKFALDGRSLFVSLARTRSTVEDRIQGRMVRLECRRSLRLVARATIFWPEGATRRTVRLSRDVSDRVISCAVKTTSGRTLDSASRFRSRGRQPPSTIRG
jgi:hypothetical protein